MRESNETGGMISIEDIAELAHAKGIAMHTDAVQSYGKVSKLVDEIGCAFLTLTAHKLHGPKGAGALYVRTGNLLAPITAHLVFNLLPFVLLALGVDFGI